MSGPLYKAIASLKNILRDYYYKLQRILTTIQSTYSKYILSNKSNISTISILTYNPILTANQTVQSIIYINKQGHIVYKTSYKLKSPFKAFYIAWVNSRLFNDERITS